MGLVHTQQEIELRVRDALLRDWDPIGVQEFPEAHNEYDSFAPDVCRLLLGGADREELLSFLWWAETEHMALRGDRKRTEEFADRLIRLANESGCGGSDTNGTS